MLLVIWLSYFRKMFVLSMNILRISLKKGELLIVPTIRNYRIVGIEDKKEVTRNVDFVLDDERLKNPVQPFDYFDELLSMLMRKVFFTPCINIKKTLVLTFCHR